MYILKKVISAVIILCIVCLLLVGCYTASNFTNPIPLVDGLDKQNNSILYNLTLWANGNRMIQIWKVDEHDIGEKTISPKDMILR